MTHPFNPLPSGQVNLMPAIEAAVQNLAAIANNVGVLAKHAAGDGDHMPIVGPLTEGRHQVFCHACSLAAEAFVYPCLVSPERAAQFPPEWLVPVDAGTSTSRQEQARSEALKQLRGMLMDTPEGSVQSAKLQSLLTLLSA